MELNLLSNSLFFFLVLGIFSSFSSSNFIAGLAPCPVQFQFLNYTIITSRCKGPKFPPNECCAAFKEFACPYINYLNDPSTDCAATMFKYITLYGGYPPGLFANMCKDEGGLDCKKALPGQM